MEIRSIVQSLASLIIHTLCDYLQPRFLKSPLLPQFRTRRGSNTTSTIRRKYHRRQATLPHLLAQRSLRMVSLLGYVRR